MISQPTEPKESFASRKLVGNVSRFKSKKKKMKIQNKDPSCLHDSSKQTLTE